MLFHLDESAIARHQNRTECDNSFGKLARYEATTYQPSADLHVLPGTNFASLCSDGILACTLAINLYRVILVETTLLFSNLKQFQLEAHWSEREGRSWMYFQTSLFLNLVRSLYLRHIALLRS
jgi:hypothetical protein